MAILINYMEELMVKVSIVIPVYNAEKYIDRCVDCLLNQTLKDIEVIFVDDGSTDNSGLLLEQWCNKVPDIFQVIHSDRDRGPGGARNLGIAKATGSYIGFMDCDDIIDRTMYEKLYNKAAEAGYDMVDCAYYNELSDESALAIGDNITGKLDDAKRSDIIAGVGYAVTKIFRLSVIKDNNIRIRENVIYEDLDSLINIALKINNTANVKEILYIYKNNDNSASHNNREQIKFNDMLAVYKAIDRLKYDCNVDEAIKYAKITCIAGAIGICLMNQDNNQFSLEDNLLNLRSISKKELVNWENNRYIQENMSKDNKDILKWFAKI